MPRTQVVIYQDDPKTVPLVAWLDGLSLKVQDKLIVRVELLAEKGYELRRPHADYLEDGIYELRTKIGRGNYRILYFFHDQQAVLSHGFTKESRIPPKEIKIALLNKARFAQDPSRHTYREE